MKEGKIINIHLKIIKHQLFDNPVFCTTLASFYGKKKEGKKKILFSTLKGGVKAIKKECFFYFLFLIKVSFMLVTLKTS